MILEKDSFKEKKEEFLKQTEKKTKDLQDEVKKIRNSAYCESRESMQGQVYLSVIMANCTFFAPLLQS